MDDGAEMRVVEIVHICGGGIDEGGVHRIRSLGASDERCAAGTREGPQRFKRLFNGNVVRTFQGGCKEVQQRAFGRVDDLGRQTQRLRQRRRLRRFWRP